MAKKKPTRKPNLSQAALERAKRELSESGIVVSQSAPVAETGTKVSTQTSKPQQQTVRSKKTMMTREELATEYGYVLTDLRNMGALAGILFIAMVVASLLINQLV
ncbi:MAG: hypothetical protein H6673_16190 [Anaerolineales bacterium]|nr:hypothetical protein [Anaerolineales bacterium]